MSINRNRAKLNKAQNSQDETKIFLRILYPPYWEDGWTWRHGNLPNHKWREFKTWKHNRKNQWKQKIYFFIPRLFINFVKNYKYGKKNL